VECSILQAFGGYTRDSLGEEPAEWVLSMFRLLNPEMKPEMSQEEIDARVEEQEALFAQGLTLDEVRARMRGRR
jgi:hypothetical protein